MRAAATVVRLMPSPRNTMMFFARPRIAPRSAACAAPSRNHQAGVSPSGCVIVGTSTWSVLAAEMGSGEAGEVAQALHRVARQAIDSRRMEHSVGIPGDYGGATLRRRDIRLHGQCRLL